MGVRFKKSFKVAPGANVAGVNTAEKTGQSKNRKWLFKILAALCFIAIFAMYSEGEIFGSVVYGIGVILFIVLDIKRARKFKNINEQTEITSEQSSDTKTEETAASVKTQYTKLKFNVAGVSYKQKEILSIAKENLEFEYSKSEIIEECLEDEKIFEYTFSVDKTELVPEPENPHDPKAIKVIMNGAHVGYIKAGSCARVKNLLASGKVIRIDGSIGGGNYKMLESEYDLDKDKDVYYMDRGHTEFWASVEIVLIGE